MTFLRSIALDALSDDEAGTFPFNVPVVRTLGLVSFDASVTLLVGENGSGKSTLLEGIAAAAKLPTIGSDAVTDDATLTAQRRLASRLRLVWSRRTPRGFFLRAEDFFGFTKLLSRMRVEFQARLAELDEEYRDRSEYAKRLASLPARRSLAEMEQRYGVDLDANSHGESFLKLFQSRFVPGGLYILDEPEAPLSPQSQLALLAMMSTMVAQDAQFIVATHSPIILSFPGARIQSCDGGRITETRYEDLEHVVLTREFLNDPQRYLRHLES